MSQRTDPRVIGLGSVRPDGPRGRPATRQVANTLTEITGGSTDLTTAEITSRGTRGPGRDSGGYAHGTGERARGLQIKFTNHMQKALSLFEKGLWPWLLAVTKHALSQFLLYS